MTPSRRSFLKASALLAIGPVAPSIVRAALPDLRPSWIKAIDEAIADPEGWESLAVWGPEGRWPDSRAKWISIDVARMSKSECLMTINTVNDRPLGTADTGTLMVCGFRRQGDNQHRILLQYREMPWDRLMKFRSDRPTERLWPLADFAAIFGGA